MAQSPDDSVKAIKSEVQPEGMAGASILDDIAETARFMDGDIERIELEGHNAIAADSPTETERRNVEARLEGEKFDEIRRAELSGTRVGRIEITGAGEKEKERRIAQAKERSKSDARRLAMAALQAQMDALDAKIAALRNKIDDFEEKHFTAEELAYFASLPEEDQFDAKNDAMKDKLARGEITQAEYDAWLDWSQDHDAMKAQRAAMEQKMQRMENLMHQNPEEHREIVEDEVEKRGTAIAEAVAESIGGAQGRVVGIVSGNQDHEGDTTIQNDDSDEQLFKQENSLLAGSTLLGSGTSLASDISEGLSVKPEPLTPRYNILSLGETEAQAENKISPQIEGQNLADVPAQNIIRNNLY
ncbi:MAG: hypothetical protein ACPGOY_11515 [Rhodospirillaceae bacterium]